METTIKQLQKQFQEELINSGKIPIFEIEVIDKGTGEKEYITAEIIIEDGKMTAQREPLSNTELYSEFIAITQIEIDENFSLDEHLQELYNAIIQDIIDSEFYELPGDQSEDYTQEPYTDKSDKEFKEYNPEYKEHPESEYFKSE
jgi:hypothetical protein